MSRDPNEPKPESLAQHRIDSKICASLIEDPDLDPLVLAEEILAEYDNDDFDDFDTFKADIQPIVAWHVEQIIRARQEGRPLG